MNREQGIVESRTLGRTMRQIGKEFSLSKQRIHQILKRNALTEKRKPLIDCDKVESLRALGISARGIGNKLGCSVTSVYRILRALEGHRRHKAG